MYGLQVGDIINTFNKKDGWKEFPISMFVEKEDGSCWAVLGKVEYLKNFGHYGERMWLIKTINGPCWTESKWYKVKN